MHPRDPIGMRAGATYTLGPGVYEFARNFGVQSLGFTPGVCLNPTARSTNVSMANDTVGRIQARVTTLSQTGYLPVTDTGLSFCLR